MWLLNATVILVLSVCMGSEQEYTQYDYDVIIMGAGMAGISAAKTLYESGVTNILIIEAQDYIGGRMKTVNFGDYNVNQGSTWIQGGGDCLNTDDLADCEYDGVIPTETHPMLIAANKYNISFSSNSLWDYSDLTVLQYGESEKRHDPSYIDSKFAKFEEAHKCILKLSDEVDRNIIDDMPYYEAQYLCGWRKPLDSFERQLDWLDFEGEQAEHPKFVSLYGASMDTYYRYGTGDNLVSDPKGYQGILLGLAQEFIDINNIENDDKILLNSPINKIEYNSDGVTVTLDNINNGYTAKYGIVTFSLGVLQSEIVEFSPELPAWKIDALFKFDFIDYCGVYIKWPYRFWDITTSRHILFDDDRVGFFSYAVNLDHDSLLKGSLVWRFDVATDLADTVSYQNINDTIK
eukprot:123713_1